MFRWVTHHPDRALMEHSRLTRRRYPKRPDSWHVFHGDVHIATIAIRPGVPLDVDQ